MPTGPSRRSSAPARQKKAIVGKSRVEPERLQRPGFVFLLSSSTYILRRRPSGLAAQSFAALEVLPRLALGPHADTSIKLLIWLRLRRTVPSVRAISALGNIEALLTAFVPGFSRFAIAARSPLQMRYPASV